MNKAKKISSAKVLSSLALIAYLMPPIVYSQDQNPAPPIWSNENNLDSTSEIPSLNSQALLSWTFFDNAFTPRSQIDSVNSLITNLTLSFSGNTPDSAPQGPWIYLEKVSNDFAEIHAQSNTLKLTIQNYSLNLTNPEMNNQMGTLSLDFKNLENKHIELDFSNPNAQTSLIGNLDIKNATTSNTTSIYFSKSMQGNLNIDGGVNTLIFGEQNSTLTGSVSIEGGINAINFTQGSGFNGSLTHSGDLSILNFFQNASINIGSHGISNTKGELKILIGEENNPIFAKDLTPNYAHSSDNESTQNPSPSSIPGFILTPSIQTYANSGVTSITEIISNSLNILLPQINTLTTGQNSHAITKILSTNSLSLTLQPSFDGLVVDGVTLSGLQVISDGIAKAENIILAGSKSEIHSSIFLKNAILSIHLGSESQIKGNILAMDSESSLLIDSMGIYNGNLKTQSHQSQSNTTLQTLNFKGDITTQSLSSNQNAQTTIQSPQDLNINTTSLLTLGVNAITTIRLNTPENTTTQTPSSHLFMEAQSIIVDLGQLNLNGAQESSAQITSKNILNTGELDVKFDTLSLNTYTLSTQANNSNSQTSLSSRYINLTASSIDTLSQNIYASTLSIQGSEKSDIKGNFSITGEKSKNIIHLGKDSSLEGDFHITDGMLDLSMQQNASIQSHIIGNNAQITMLFENLKNSMLEIDLTKSNLSLSIAGNFGLKLGYDSQSRANFYLSDNSANQGTIPNSNTLKEFSNVSQISIGENENLSLKSLSSTLNPFKTTINWDEKSKTLDISGVFIASLTKDIQILARENSIVSANASTLILNEGAKFLTPSPYLQIQSLYIPNTNQIASLDNSIINSSSTILDLGSNLLTNRNENTTHFNLLEIGGKDQGLSSKQGLFGGEATVILRVDPGSLKEIAEAGGNLKTTAHSDRILIHQAEGKPTLYIRPILLSSAPISYEGGGRENQNNIALITIPNALNHTQSSIQDKIDSALVNVDFLNAYRGFEIMKTQTIPVITDQNGYSNPNGSYTTIFLASTIDHQILQLAKNTSLSVISLPYSLFLKSQEDKELKNPQGLYLYTSAGILQTHLPLTHLALNTQSDFQNLTLGFNWGINQKKKKEPKVRDFKTQSNSAQWSPLIENLPTNYLGIGLDVFKLNGKSQAILDENLGQYFGIKQASLLSAGIFILHKFSQTGANVLDLSKTWKKGFYTQSKLAFQYIHTSSLLFDKDSKGFENWGVTYGQQIGYQFLFPIALKPHIRHFLSLTPLIDAKIAYYHSTSFTQYQGEYSLWSTQDPLYLWRARTGIKFGYESQEEKAHRGFFMGVFYERSMGYGGDINFRTSQELEEKSLISLANLSNQHAFIANIGAFFLGEKHGFSINIQRSFLATFITEFEISLSYSYRRSKKSKINPN